MKKNIKQRIAISAIAATVMLGVAPVATAAPAEAYTITAYKWVKISPYLMGWWECYVNYNAWEEWVLRKRDGWYSCSSVW